MPDFNLLDLEGTHLVATYDLGIDQLFVPRWSQPRLEQMARLSELVVAGVGFEPTDLRQVDEIDPDERKRVGRITRCS